MAQVLSNEETGGTGGDFRLLKVRVEKPSSGGSMPAMGQFYMLRAWETEPLLSRPISVFDAGEDTRSFLYRISGRGTRAFAELKPGDAITLLGPLGQGFASVEGRIALVGGGAGIAPLYFAAREIRRESPASSVDIFLGFSGKPLLEENYRALCGSLTIQSGGFITDAVRPDAYDHILACGPDPMMRTLFEKCGKGAVRLQVSLERRMACGVGACLVCSCKGLQGNKKVCRDGPVFDAAEVYGL
jgi:dihydroorotate dehydrogenase electron transfer subunit